MVNPPSHERESERLQVLADLDLLDTGAEERFDALTRLAAHVAGCPVALLSLLDEDRQWFKSRVGLDLPETPRAVSFCGHAVLGAGMMVVPDAALDDRFSDNPLVSGAPGIRFYAGVPLRVEGLPIGTLCVMHTRPRHLEEDQRARLWDLAATVERLLDARLAARRSVRAADRMLQAASAASDVQWESDAQGHFTWAATHLGEQAHMALPSLQAFAVAAGPDDASRALRAALLGGSPFRCLEIRLPEVDGKRPVWWLSGYPVRDDNGRSIGFRGTAIDMSPHAAWRDRAMQADRRLQAAVDALALCVVMTNARGDIVLSNRAWQQYFAPARAGTPASWQDLWRALAQAGALPGAVGRETAFVDALLNPGHQGTPAEPFEFAGRWWLMHVQPTGDGGAMHVLMDDTARHESRQRLERLLGLYRSAADALEDGLIVLDEHGNVIQANPAARRISRLAGDGATPYNIYRAGLDRIDEQGRSLDPASHPGLRAMREGQAVRDAVYGIRRDDGSTQWLRVTAVPLPRGCDNGDGVCEAVMSFRDITQERQREQLLVQSERRWSLALRGSGDGVWDWDLSTGKAYFSRRWKSMLGHETRDIGDDPSEWTNRVHPDDLPTVMHLLNDHLEGRSSQYESEHRLRCKDGSHRWMLHRGRVVDRDAQGAAQRMVGTHTDITARRGMQEARAAQALAEASSRAKSAFMSRMSHELRTPMNAVLGYAQLLMHPSTQPADPAQQRRYVEQIHAAGTHLMALIDDVLDLQRIESDSFSVTTQTVSVQRAVQDAVEMLSPQALAADMLLVVAPSVGRAGHVLADPRRLQQMLINLLGNALKYGGPGGWVNVSAHRRSDGRSVIEVADGGPGIDPTLLPRLFQPFDRLGREGSNTQGSGLGLLITRRLAHEMGGDIEVDSVVGEGSRFRIVLPGAALVEVGRERDADWQPAPDSIRPAGVETMMSGAQAA